MTDTPWTPTYGSNKDAKTSWIKTIPDGTLSIESFKEKDSRIYGAFSFNYLNGATYIFSMDEKNGKADVPKKNKVREMNAGEIDFAYKTFEREMDNFNIESRAIKDAVKSALNAYYNKALGALKKKL